TSSLNDVLRRAASRLVGCRRRHGNSEPLFPFLVAEGRRRRRLTLITRKGESPCSATGAVDSLWWSCWWFSQSWLYWRDFCSRYSPPPENGGGKELAWLNCTNS